MATGTSIRMTRCESQGLEVLVYGLAADAESDSARAQRECTLRYKVVNGRNHNADKHAGNANAEC